VNCFPQQIKKKERSGNHPHFQKMIRRMALISKRRFKICSLSATAVSELWILPIKF
jgi:hypothetical protein